MDTNRIYEEALRLWRNTAAAKLNAASFCKSAVQGAGDLLLLGENLALMAALSRQLEAKERTPFTLVYMDPPYFSNRDYAARVKLEASDGEVYTKIPAFADTWRQQGADAMESYLAMLTPRLIAAQELLSEDGVLWLHLDHHAVHYAKVMADAVFGGEHFLNEVIWSYKSGGASAKHFARKHDTLLFYAKNKRKYKFYPQKEKSYNRDLKPYRFQGVKEYEDAVGWYTLVNMKDVWELQMLGRTAAERTGYATQKPEALLERIVLTCTEAGDSCLDPFGGSGTLAAVCARLSRRWVSIDENPLAIQLAAKRLGL